MKRGLKRKQLVVETAQARKQASEHKVARQVTGQGEEEEEEGVEGEAEAEAEAWGGLAHDYTIKDIVSGKDMT
jgi:hypothetical protein